MQARTHSEGIGFDQSLGAFELDPLVLNTKVSSDSERIVLCNFTIKVVRIVANHLRAPVVISGPPVVISGPPVVISGPVSRYMWTIIGKYDGSLVLVERDVGLHESRSRFWHGRDGPG